MRSDPAQDTTVSAEEPPPRALGRAPRFTRAEAAPRAVVISTFILQLLLLAGLILFAARGDWQNSFLTLAVIALTVTPAFLLPRYRIYVPAEFQLVAAAFVFFTLYLGSAQDLYYQFWWWDDLFHAGSGFLLGVVGWIVLFVLNGTDRLPPGIRPSFLCFFGVTFAVFIGVLWEIFEYAVDSLWPAINMMSQETGVDDTMSDLIMNTVGAIAVAVMGWGYFKTGRYSFLADTVRAFIKRNPGLFRRRRRTRRRPRHAAGPRLRRA